MTKDRDDIAARLERLATRMFQSGNWGSDLETVKDAKDTILGLRTCLEAACSDAKEAETFAEELLAKDREPMPGETGVVIDISERLPHSALYASCMECAEDWVAVAPKGVETGLECPTCGAMAGERVRTGDLEWFNRYMAGPDQKKRTLVLLNAGRMGL